MKHVKQISYIVALSIVFSSIQPVLARNKLTNDTGRSVSAKPRSTELESQFKSVSRRLREYIKCFISQAGCSRARKITLVAAIVGLLYLVGWKKHRDSEQFQASLAQSKKGSKKVLRESRTPPEEKEEASDED